MGGKQPFDNFGHHNDAGDKNSQAGNNARQASDHFNREVYQGQEQEKQAWSPQTDESIVPYSYGKGGYAGIRFPRMDMVPLQPSRDAYVYSQGQYLLKEFQSMRDGSPFNFEDVYAPRKIIDNWVRSNFAPAWSNVLQDYFRYELNKDLAEYARENPNASPPEMKMKVGEKVWATTQTTENQLNDLKNWDPQVNAYLQDRLSKQMSAVPQDSFREVVWRAKFDDHTGQVMIYEGNAEGKYGTFMRLNVVGAPPQSNDDQFYNQHTKGGNPLLDGEPIPREAPLNRQRPAQVPQAGNGAGGQEGQIIGPGGIGHFTMQNVRENGVFPPSGSDQAGQMPQPAPSFHSAQGYGHSSQRDYESNAILPPRIGQRAEQVPEAAPSIHPVEGLLKQGSTDRWGRPTFSRLPDGHFQMNMGDDRDHPTVITMNERGQELSRKVFDPQTKQYREIKP